MTKYARIQDGKLIEIIETDNDITELYHSSLVWVDITKKTANVGDLWDGKEFKPALTPIKETFPNVPGFISEIKTLLGGIIALNQLMKLYPAFQGALDNGEWGDIKELVIDAKSTNAINGQQYSDFQKSFSNNNIPITLP